MGVDVAQGSPLEIVVPLAILGSSSGRSIALNNVSWIALAASTIIYTCTATAGTRAPVLKFVDAQGNEICRSVNGTGPGAGAQFRYPVGPDLAVFATNAVVSMPFPYPTLIPPGSSMVVQDAANIDVNDQISGTIVFTT